MENNVMNKAAELNLEELEKANGGFGWDDFWEGVKEFFKPPKQAKEVLWP